MADSKITALTAISTVDPAADPLVIVDVSDTSMAASGTTKKSTINQLLGAGGTATLASATISGDLTVDTSTLKVDSANNRVGVLTASPINTLHVNGEVTLPINNLQYWNAYYSGGFKSVAAGYAGYTAFATNGDFVLANTDASAAGAASALTFYNRYRISNAGIHTWETVGGVAGTAMTLNSTGLGVGVSPTEKLSVNGGASFSGFGINAAPLNPVSTSQRQARFQNTGGDFYIGIEGSVGGGFFTGSTAYAACLYNAANTPLQLFTNGTLRATIDTSGNVGIGVTPSAKLHVEGNGAQGRFSVASATDARHEYYRNGVIEGLIGWDANVFKMFAFQSGGKLEFYTGGSNLRATLKSTGQLRFVPLAADPAGAEAGDVYYNSTSNKLKCYNGTTWNDLF